MCTTWRCLYHIVAAYESGLNTCSKPHLSSACVAQSAALRAATLVTGVRIPPVPFFCFFFINQLNSVFGLFSNIKPLTIWFTLFPLFQCEPFTGLSSACPDCCSRYMICKSAVGPPRSPSMSVRVSQALLTGDSIVCWLWQWQRQQRRQWVQTGRPCR